MNDVLRYAISVESTYGDPNARVLRLYPIRGLGHKYAKSKLSEWMCVALERYLGFVVTPDGSLRAPDVDDGSPSTEVGYNGNLG